MGEKLVIGPFNKGLRNGVTPFNIDNDSFPTLINAYQWRGRVKRKRGTSLLGRLQRELSIASLSGTFGLGGAGVLEYSLPDNLGISINEPNANFVPGTVSSPLIITIAAPISQTLTDTLGTGIFTVSAGIISSAYINYATGHLFITFSGAGAASLGTFTGSYYSSLPVMGLEDFARDDNQFPGTIAFDTRYAYNISTNSPYLISDVSFYKNPQADVVNLPGYVPKGTLTPVVWNGADYQQFWTVNYQGALWATNGLRVPFIGTGLGMQFKSISAPGVVGAGTTVNITITAHGLVVGDFVYVNEVVGMTGINFQSGYVTVVVDVNTVTVVFPFATIAGAYSSGGIVQYLTNSSDTTVDCIRWYDGHPQEIPTGRGWVNFCPPISQSDFSIGDLPADQYYLIGAKMVVNFKDRLLFIGPVVQTSATGSQEYLQDTVIYSQNGTGFYTSSWAENATFTAVTSPTTVFHPILTPDDQTATAPAYFGDSAGFGGYITAGIEQPITTCGSTGDILILGFTTTQTRFVYTGNDVIPFNFFITNSELGSGSTFSSINYGSGVITRGSRGYVLTSQDGTERIDLEIPDEVFQIVLNDNGDERFCSQRDFINEWIYFTYPSNVVKNNKFPNTSLLYNYRDNSWAVFYEGYTTYGAFRKQTGLTWATIGLTYKTWGQWTAPWNAGSSTLLQSQVIAGNQQGFVMVRDEGTSEGTSLFIQSFSSNTVTSANHGLNNADFILISDALGTIGTQINNEVFSVFNVTTDTFSLNPPITTGTYLGGALITRLYKPFIQTKQFPTAWGDGRKTRIGTQQYLLTTTDGSQITLLIYLSQNADDPYNDGPIVPSNVALNNALIYSTVLYTCPESTNLGLTPYNVNLQMPTAIQQDQIWHRVNTSLIGDTVQLGFTLSDDQMRDVDDEGGLISQDDEIEIHGIIIDVSPSMSLA